MSLGTVSGTLAVNNNILAFNSSGIFGPDNNPFGRVTLINNCVYNPDGDNSLSQIGFGNIFVDPKLSAPALGAVHLQAQSPCIDAGYDMAVSSEEIDLDGQPRIQGAHSDIGADEFNGVELPFSPAVVRISLSGDDANDGSNWALAKRTIQSAIDQAATSGGKVWIAKGEYHERITLKPFVFVQGGYVGTQEAPDERDPLDHITIMDGSAGGSVVTALAGHRVSGIDGVTLRHGSGTLSNGFLLGGAVYCVFSGPVIADCVLRENKAQNGGGAYSSYGSPLIAHNRIMKNDGNGVLVSWSSAKIVGNRIEGNSATTGGGIRCNNSTPRITQNVFAGNTSQDGAGIYTYESFPSIPNNAIMWNVAESSGGGIFSYGSASSPEIWNNTIVWNTGDPGGAIMCSSSSST